MLSRYSNAGQRSGRSLLKDPTRSSVSPGRPTPIPDPHAPRIPWVGSCRPPGVPPAGGLPAVTAPWVEAVSLPSGQALCPRGGGAAPIRVPALGPTSPQRRLHPQLRAQSDPCWPHCLSAGVGWVRPEERQQPRSACVCVHRHVWGRVLAPTPQTICQKAAKCSS